jgi:hypothetical protein
MGDGARELLCLSCGTAAIPVVRSLFEASLSLSYLLVFRETYVQRSLSWLCANVHGQIESRKRLEPGTQEGRRFIETYLEQFPDTNRHPGADGPNSELAQEIEKLRVLLQRPQFEEVEAEFQARTKETPYPRWFSLFDGPKNLKQLAGRLRRGAEYASLYSDWSGVAHGSDLARYVTSHEGRVVFESMRRPEEVQRLSLLTSLLMVGAIRAMIGHFREGEDLSRWYLREVKPPFDALSNMRVSIQPLAEQ